MTTLDAGQFGRERLLDFRWFLKGHPDTNAALTSSPELVRDRNFLDTHRDPESCLDGHRAFARTLHRHPAQVLKRIARLKAS
jgi:hypothetical protein